MAKAAALMIRLIGEEAFIVTPGFIVRDLSS
jgi:hypothetical protein